MNLPTQQQISAATRHVVSAVGGAILMFGLTSKISVENATALVNALSGVVSNLVILLGVIGPIAAGYYASKSASPTSQAASLAANVPGTVIVTTPEIAAAVPSNNVISNTETQATVTQTVKDAKQ